MSDVRPFKALRPVKDLAYKVASLPYDVMSGDEARKMAEGNPYSFLHVTKSEIDLDPAVDQYDNAVYEKAADNLQKLINDGVLIADCEPCYYIYAQTMNGRTQTGVAACASIDEYLNGKIKKHELTREAKEQDRVRHVITTGANTGPVFLTHKPHPGISAFIKKWTAEHEPEYDFVSEIDDGVTHTVWVVCEKEAVSELKTMFSEIDTLYIADGHHRNASAARAAKQRREENPALSPDDPCNFYLSVIFSSDELNIMDYNRVVKTLNGNTEEEFLDAVKESFAIELFSDGPYRPEARHNFGMFLSGKWYKLTAKPELIDESDPVLSLDVSILQTHLLEPVLGIKDPRTDSQIDFIGGLRGLKALEDSVNGGGFSVAFSMFPTSMGELMRIADSGLIMPPKSTWFEPKLRSGLFVNKISSASHIS